MPKEITQDEIKALGAINKGVIKRYGKLSAYYQEEQDTEAGKGTIKSLPLLVAEAYNEGMQGVMESVLNDELYDQRQAGVLIERAAQKYYEERMEEVDQIVNEYRQQTEALKEEIEEEIELTNRIYAKRDKADLDYYEDKISTLKTELFMSEDPAAIERIAKDLLKGAEKDPMLAKLLTRNGYLFAEQAKTVTEDPAELSRLRAKLSGVLKEAREYEYRPEQKALLKMKSNLNEAIYDPTSGKRSMERMKNHFIKQAAQLKKDYEQERMQEIQKQAAVMARGY